MSSLEGSEEVRPNPDVTPSIEIVLDLVRTRHAYQLFHADALDAKANFLLGSATLLTVAAAALHSTVHRITGWLVLVAMLIILCYVSVVITSLVAYWVRGYDDIPPLELIPYIWQDTQRTMGDVSYEMANACTANARVVASKARWLKVALIAFSVEAGLLGSVAVIQLFS